MGVELGVRKGAIHVAVSLGLLARMSSEGIVKLSRQRARRGFLYQNAAAVLETLCQTAKARFRVARRSSAVA